MQKAIVIALACLLWGCATGPDPYGPGAMLPGRLICLADGHVLPVQVEITPMSRPSGRIIAMDGATGEQFTGTYTFVVETKVVQSSQPGFLFDTETGQSVQTSDVAPGNAVLIGDKGTVVSLKITAKAGRPPTGYGEGDDNKGRKYSLQF